MIKIGQVGCGNWGKNITRDLLVLNCTVYIVDLNEEAKQRALDLGASDVYSAIDDLPECDGYIVAVPIPDLIHVCAELLKFKKPIFSEKTLLTKQDDFEKLKNLGGIDYIFLMHKWRYHPGIEALRIVAESGVLGQIEEVMTLRHVWMDDYHGGDVFWTLAVHDLTIVKHILGFIPENINFVNTIKNNSGLDVSFSAILGNKPSVIMSVSGIHCNKICSVSIQGNKGSASLNNALDDHIILKTAAGEKIISIDTTYPLFLELQEFFNFLKGGELPKCNLFEAKEISNIIFKLKIANGGL